MSSIKCVADDGLKCVRCRKPMVTARHVRKCRVQATSPCVHRGEELRLEECKTCSGRVEVKVFACAIKVECTLAKDIGLPVCDSCPDWSCCEKTACHASTPSQVNLRPKPGTAADNRNS